MPDRRSPHRARQASPPGQVTRSPATAAGRGRRGNQDAPAGHAALRSNGLPAHTWAIGALSAGYRIHDRAARNRFAPPGHSKEVTLRGRHALRGRCRRFYLAQPGSPSVSVMISTLASLVIVTVSASWITFGRRRRTLQSVPASGARSRSLRLASHRCACLAPNVAPAAIRGCRCADGPGGSEGVRIICGV